MQCVQHRYEDTGEIHARTIALCFQHASALDPVLAGANDGNLVDIDLVRVPVGSARTHGRRHRLGLKKTFPSPPPPGGAPRPAVCTHAWGSQNLAGRVPVLQRNSLRTGTHVGRNRSWPEWTSPSALRRTDQAMCLVLPHVQAAPSSRLHWPARFRPLGRLCRGLRFLSTNVVASGVCVAF